MLHFAEGAVGRSKSAPMKARRDYCLLSGEEMKLFPSGARVAGFTRVTSLCGSPVSAAIAGDAQRISKQRRKLKLVPLTRSFGTTDICCSSAFANREQAATATLPGPTNHSSSAYGADTHLDPAGKRRKVSCCGSRRDLRPLTCRAQDSVVNGGVDHCADIDCRCIGYVRYLFRRTRRSSLTTLSQPTTCLWPKSIRNNSNLYKHV